MSLDGEQTWERLTSLLMRLADWHTWGADVDDGEVPWAAQRLAEAAD